MQAVLKTWIVALACCAGAAQAASNFAVSSGTWVVSEELDGKPGRGMGIEVRDDFLIMSVYNYAASGQATFHLTMGAVQDNRYSGELRSYSGGRYFGGPAQNGVDAGSAGVVKIQFHSGTRGVIQFPGEAEKAISRFVFDGLQPGEIEGRGRGAGYMLTALDSANRPVSGTVMALNHTAERGLYTDYGPCQIAGDIATCDVYWEFGESVATVSFRRFGRQLEGTYQRKGSSSKSRMVGTRLMTSAIPGSQQTLQYDTPSRGWVTERTDGSSVPEPGLWGISGELNGQPGRGMVMDVQGNTLFMQMYAYERDGSPTFRIGLGDYREGKSTLSMQKVNGGRYYGSGPLSGSVVGTDGEAQVRFSSTTQGQIRLPGEGWVDIQKVWAGAGGSDPAALLGQWLTLDLWGFAGQVSKVDALTEIVDGKAQSSGGRTKCWFETTPQGTVRCQSFMREYRFTPPYGRGASAASSMVMKNNGEPSTKVENTLVLVQRVVDSHGVVSGNGNR